MDNCRAPKKSVIRHIPFVFSLFLAFVFQSCASTPEPPLWLTDVRAAYPDARYLARRGDGATVEAAKTSALSALSQYIRSTVETQLSEVYTYTDAPGAVSEDSVLREVVSITTNLELYGLEYSEPYFSKQAKRYYCVAYIDREYAWDMYEPKIRKERTAFYQFYNEARAQAEKEPLLAAQYFVKAREQGEVLLATIEYGRLLNKEKAVLYATDIDDVASIPQKQEETRKNAVLYLSVTGDSGNIVSAKLKSDLEGAGFELSPRRAGSRYVVEVAVNLNMEVESPGTEFELFTATPDISIAVTGKDSGRPIHTYALKAGDRAVSYFRANTTNAALRLLNDEMGDSFVRSLNAAISGR